MAANRSISYADTRQPVQQMVFSSTAAGPVVLLGRLLLVLIFLSAAPRNFLSQTAAYVASQGVPLASIFVPLSGIVSLVGALLVLLGYHGKIGAWLLVLFLVCVTPTMHKFWGITDPTKHQLQYIMFMKNLSMLGGALFISQAGTGPWSLERPRKVIP
jgi:putative oxidoreductase